MPLSTKINEYVARFYDLAIKQCNVISVLDARIRWDQIRDVFDYYMWMPRSFDTFKEYLLQKGFE